MFKDVLYVNFVVSMLFKCMLLFFCAIPMEKEKICFFSMLRKMSIIVYFTHFVFTVIWRTLVEKKILSYEYGFIEFFVVLICSVFVAYVIVKLSNRIKSLKYLY